MQSFAFISLAGLLIYTLLFSIFISAKKNRLLRYFTLLLFCMILWSGGSLFMRIQFLNATAFWYHISLIGIWAACLVLDRFVILFADQRITRVEQLVNILVPIILLGNCITGWFLAPPKVVSLPDGTTSFVYGNFTIGTYLMYALLAVIAIIILTRLVQIARSSRIARSQLIPLTIGAVFIFGGNALILLPIFKGIPLDMASGIVFAFCLLFALYYKHLFSLTLAFSRRTYTLITAAILVFVVAQCGPAATAYLESLGEPIASRAVVIIALVVAGLSALIYLFVSRLSEELFLGEYNERSSQLKQFSDTISRYLNEKDVCTSYCKQVLASLHTVDSVRICTENKNGSFEVSGSTGMLETGTVLFGSDSAVADWLRNHRDILEISDFSRSVEYRAMWESEKLQLLSIGADYLLPMLDGDTLLGIVALKQKDPTRRLHSDERDFLLSLSSVTSIALKNSRLYEKATHDAHTDDLTGLLNRKYFLEQLNNCFSNNPKGLLSLMILSLDDFKLYNQLYGVRVGDEALRRVAEILRTTVGEQNCVARYSGKEFAILLPGQETSTARRLAENLRRQIYDLNRENNEQDGTLQILTCSIGICSIPFGACNIKQLLDNTDLAVYQMKQRGKNGVMVYSVGSVSEKLPVTKPDHARVYSNYANTIYALSAAIDAKDHYTFTHSKNVAYYACELAKLYGLNDDTIEIIRESALLHDIGKIGIPEAILNKPDVLTSEEYEIMKRHPENAVAIIRHLPSLDYVIPAVLGHHERWDGKGYPRRLSGEDIPLNARILCVADCFDAITSNRCYKDGRPVEAALSILENNAGTQFDPYLVQLFIHHVQDGSIIPQNRNDSVSANV